MCRKCCDVVSSVEPHIVIMVPEGEEEYFAQYHKETHEIPPDNKRRPVGQHIYRASTAIGTHHGEPPEHIHLRAVYHRREHTQRILKSGLVVQEGIYGMKNQEVGEYNIRIPDTIKINSPSFQFHTMKQEGCYACCQGHEGICVKVPIIEDECRSHTE